MVKQAFLRANIPFSFTDVDVFCENFTQKAENDGWKKQALQGNNLLKHINTSFAHNVVGFSKACDNLTFVIHLDDPNNPTIKHHYPTTISQLQVYCFDTGIGFFTFHIPYKDVDDSVIINTCPVLHSSAHQKSGNQGIPLTKENVQTYLSNIAAENLAVLFDEGVLLFPTLNDISLRRINMFSAGLCEKNDDNRANTKLCYCLANAYDNREKSFVEDENQFYHQQDYICWGFSKRGCSVVANLTGLPINDQFLTERWLSSVESNYFYLYLLVLHEKFAIYNFLNDIAEDPDKSELKINQKALLDFRSKHIFSIVSDEQHIQRVYEKIKQANNTDDLYPELIDQLQQMFDHTQYQSNKSNELINRRISLISAAIGAVCSVSIIFDTADLFSTRGYTLGFNSIGNMCFTGTIIFEVVLFITVLILVLCSNRKKKIKKSKRPQKS